MDQSIFDKWIIAGGWAMFLLIPATIVALASFLRGVLFILDPKRSRGAGKGEPMDAALQPLLWIYGLAPLVGAVGAIFQALDAAERTHLVPLLWGMVVGLFAGLAWFALKQFSGGERGRGVLIIPGIVAMVAAFVLAVTVDSGPALPARSGEPTLYVGAHMTSERPASDEVPVLSIRADGYAINDQPVADGDVIFRLSALASRAEGIVLNPDSDIDARRFAEALALVNQAGFVHVGVETGSTP